MISERINPPVILDNIQTPMNVIEKYFLDKQQ